MSERFDLIVRGARVYDGEGAAPREADVGVIAGRIAEIGNLDARSGTGDVDASWLAL